MVAATGRDAGAFPGLEFPGIPWGVRGFHKIPYDSMNFPRFPWECFGFAGTSSVSPRYLRSLSGFP